MIPDAPTGKAIVPSVATAWTTGQYVATTSVAPADKIHWSGSAWVDGPTP